MAYLFLAEKEAADLSVLHEELLLLEIELIECFPILSSDHSQSLGISIPFKALDHPQFSYEVVTLMRHLILERGFKVTDLYTGSAVTSDGIEKLPKQIAS